MSETIMSKPLTKQGRENWDKIFKWKHFNEIKFHSYSNVPRCEALIELLKKEENQ